MASAIPWGSAVPAFVVAALVAMVLIPVSSILARATGAVAHPDTRRLHPRPTPQLGGTAMCAGFAVALTLFGHALPYQWQLVVISAAVTAFMAADDILDLPWWSKLIIIIGAGVAVVVAGISITFVAVPGSHGTNVVQLGWLAIPITVLWVSGMEVSINFLDGADGVAAGVVGIVALVTLLAAINRIGTSSDIQSGVVVASAALMGCCLGFLVFNLPPARVFMGDSGSNFLGVAVAALTIIGIAKVAVGLSLLVPLIALGLPIGDTAWAIVRRRRAGVSPATADTGHLHHRLRAMGMTPMETALAFYFATGLLGCIGLAFFGHRRVLDVAAALLVIGLAALWWRQRRRARGRRPEDVVTVPGRPAIPARWGRDREAD